MAVTLYSPSVVLAADWASKAAALVSADDASTPFVLTTAPFLSALVILLYFGSRSRANEFLLSMVSHEMCFKRFRIKLSVFEPPMIDGNAQMPQDVI